MNQKTNIRKVFLVFGILAVAGTIFIGTSFAGTTISSNISTDGTFTVNGNSTFGDTSGDAITVNGAPTFNTTSTFTLQGSETVTINRDTSAASAVGINLVGTPGTVNYANNIGLYINQQNNASGSIGWDYGILLNNEDSDAGLTTGIAITSTTANYTNGISIDHAITPLFITSVASSSGTAYGVRVEGAAAASGATLEGVSIGAMASPGAGTENAISISEGWDNEIVFSDTTPKIKIADGSYITITDGSNSLITLTDVGPYGSILVARPIKPKTASYSVLNTESNTVLTNDGAAGTITFTLPTPNAGLHYTFMNVENQSLVIDTPASTQIVSLTNAQGDSITSDTQYESITLIAHNSGSGGEWVAESCTIVGSSTTNTCFGGGTVGWTDTN